jgi:uncharacterized protein YqgC (DUF456 family)
MSEFFQSIDYTQAGDIAWVSLAWFTTGSLLLLGLIGTLVPFLPGHLLIFFAAVAHRLMLGAESGVEWWTFVVLGTLLAISQTLEFMSGAMGTRWFGGSKWGASGALLGGVIGMFFMPFGLFLGPLIGSMIFEFFFAKKKAKPATVSGIGSVLGTVAGMGIKIVIGLIMILWFAIDIIWI